MIRRLLAFGLFCLCTSLAYAQAPVAYAHEATAEQPSASSDDADLALPSPPSSPYQFTLGYWNDNVIMSELMEPLIRHGSDDFVTTSLWGRLMHEGAKRWIIADFYYNVLTNKAAFYRADLLTLRVSVEQETALGLVRLGGGFANRGNLGGSTLQNGFHAMFDIPEVHLPYTADQRFGGLVHVRYETPRVHPLVLEARGYGAISHATAAAPSHLATGLTVQCCSSLKSSRAALQVQGHLGYTHYYASDALLSPLFGEGLTWGLLLSAGLRDVVEAAFWLTRNQYGVYNQPQFGMSLTFGWNGTRTRDLGDGY